jgi:hypothetical protein
MEPDGPLCPGVANASCYKDSVRQFPRKSSPRGGNFLAVSKHFFGFPMRVKLGAVASIAQATLSSRSPTERRARAWL